MDKELLKYHEVMAALRRILATESYKSQMAKANNTKKYAQGKMVLYESIIHYLDIHAKRHIQGPDREEVPQSVNLPIRGGKECPITGYR